ncbi:hypothetical protein Caci_6445 [Catenulispora acidiphila DSM 44928]|uniref:Uncharacterized protein n=1 Tax=Catenulispora acidiphila (strain DSM 44928 / JCM 14897 / NBRC 102108 / NRRL B-24433 / ID139908) TaxID=479433 RepID=C7PWL7_CATAD|nr:hypothetical protein Caci_6445 [Catenulispora acidiphila DSM 44928]
MPASEGRGPVQASDKQVDKVFEIDEVSGAGTVVKCMGRTFSAVAADGEVTITDVTDITRPVRLGLHRFGMPKPVSHRSRADRPVALVRRSNLPMSPTPGSRRSVPPRGCES